MYHMKLWYIFVQNKGFACLVCFKNPHSLQLLGESLGENSNVFFFHDILKIYQYTLVVFISS